ncbi:MAG: hypothetical protein R6X33_11355 [Candidatus Brocadiia bacterium]
MLEPLEARLLLSGGVTELMSLACRGAQANDYSYRPVVTAGGRYVAFASFADNLAPGDTEWWGMALSAIGITAPWNASTRSPTAVQPTIAAGLQS